jgi:type II secretory pathway pseudopilin PulG
MRRGMAQAEWLIVLGVLSMLAGIVVPTVWAYRRHQRLSMARADVTVLLQASRRFFEDYRYWPTEHTGQYGDFRYGDESSNREVLNVLRAVDGPGNPDHSVNPRKIVYIEVAPYREGWSGLTPDGAFVDPWNTLYQVVLDTDLNNSCIIDRSIYKPLLGEGVGVWSCGPDQRSDTPDDILSWAL